MPSVRPFRALRYDPAVVADPRGLGAVICPPYDVISGAERLRLLARHPRNAVRIELPVAPGDPPDDAGYGQAAGTLQAWRGDGTLRLDEHPALYVYEETYRLGARSTRDANDQAPVRVQRGFFAAVGLEPLGAGIRPHERTLSAPKEDRLRLLRATATDTSPIVLLADEPGGNVASLLERVADGAADDEAVDDDGTRHRLWAVPAESTVARQLIAAAEARPLTIADGHHRYETALRYRDERRAARSGEGVAERTDDEDGFPNHGFVARFDFVLALVLDAGDPSGLSGPTILPTHRLLRGGEGGITSLRHALEPYFSMTERRVEELVRAFSPPFAGRPDGRLGLLTREGASELVARREAIEPLFGSDVPAVVRSVDTAVLDVVLEQATETDRGRLGYTHDAWAALDAFESGDAAAAFLLQPTPVADVVRVAAAGALMPQKSTYFFPKAATGLVMYPLG